MSEYYAIQRSDEYLEHYGIKGMKWGVRKALARGSDRALRRQYKKAAKKLAKLEKRGASGKKYAKRAAAYAAGAAAAGGLAALGTGGASRLIRKGGSAVAQGNRIIGGVMSNLGRAAVEYGGTGFHSNFKKKVISAGKALNSAGKAVSGTAGGVTKGARGAANALVKWGNENTIGQAGKTLVRRFSNDGGSVARGINKALYRTGHGQLVAQGDKLGKITNNTIARIGAGAIGAGFAAASAKNAYRAATAKRNQRKAAEFRKEMNKAFANTQYANGMPAKTKKRKRR